MRGFTIVELMTVALIFALILVATFSILTAGRKSWQIGTTQVEVQQEARRAMDRMVSELREGSSIDQSTFTDGVSDDIIRFTLEEETIEFAVVQVESGKKQLQRTPEGTTPILANDVESVQFNLFGGDIVYITLTTKKNSISGHFVETDLNSQVVLRN